MRRLVFVALAVSLVPVIAFAGAAPSHTDAALIARGRLIAKTNCGRCHAIGKSGLSANPKSPPFRFLARRYPLPALEESLAEGIMVGHQGLEMPHFRLSPARIDALIAYLSSVQVK
jgi:cytochrome c